MLLKGVRFGFSLRRARDQVSKKTKFLIGGAAALAVAILGSFLAKDSINAYRQSMACKRMGGELYEGDGTPLRCRILVRRIVRQVDGRTDSEPFADSIYFDELCAEAGAKWVPEADTVVEKVVGSDTVSARKGICVPPESR